MESKILDFYREFNEEVKTRLIENNHESRETAFKEVYLSYLSEAEISYLADTELISFKRDSDQIRLDGYAYSEYFHSLSLLVCKFNPKPEPEKIWKKDVEKAVKKALKFYKSIDSDYFDEYEETSDGYRAYKAISEVRADIQTVNIVFLTNDESINYVVEDTKLGKVTVKYEVWDIERLYQTVFNGAADTKSLIIRLKNKYKCPLTMIKANMNNETYDCYVGIIPGQLLATIYKDEGQNLIQKNVRSFLRATGKVNSGIKKSLQDEPEMFMAYNNGISTIADAIVTDEKSSVGDVTIINEITGWQIVNGGQTTASIFNALQSKQSLADVNVQIKLSVIKNREQASVIASNISKYANSQNKINMSDFNANDPYHIEMEKVSRNTYIPANKGKSSDQWFYERARGQYMVELNRQTSPAKKRDFKLHIPKTRCVSKTVAAKCLMAYAGYPSIVSKGLETNFVEFSEKVTEGEFPKPSKASYIDMISKVILFNRCDKIIADLQFGGFKAQQNYYVIALLGKYYPDLYDADYIWMHQDVSPETAQMIEELAYKVWNHFQHPLIAGVNIGQWCKKDECWSVLQSRFEKHEI